MRKAVLVVIAILALPFLHSHHAHAEIRIEASPGGRIGDYLTLFAAVRETGERVVIDGPCFSACTLVVSVVPADRICVTQRAVLGFHAAWTPGRRGRQLTHNGGTQLLMETYPPAVRSWIKRRGGLTRRLILLRGRELAAFYPRCA